MNLNQSKSERVVRIFFRAAFALGVLFAVWAAAVKIVRQSNLAVFKGGDKLDDLATLLFGASSIALALVSLVIAIAALIGWQLIEKALVRIAEATTEAAKKPLEIEMRGRLLHGLGYMRGESSINHERFEVVDKAGLLEAISLCEQGYALLKKVGGPAEFAVLNNIVYYHCVNKSRSKSEFLLSNARRLLEAGIEHDSINIQLTACRAILQFGKDVQEKERARSILIDIKLASESTEEEKREAQRHLHDLRLA